MANTTIQLKHSTIIGNIPTSLANGEISINNRDGKFFYSTPSGTIITHYPYLGPSGLNKEVQFNDSGTLGSNSGLTFDKSTGVFNAPIVASSNNGNGTNFKVGDDAWIGDVNLADTIRISGQQNVNNAFITFGASNANTLGRAGTGPLTYTGDFKATGLVSGNELTSTNSTGSEGGQVNLAIPASGTSLVSSVTIDVYGNQLRFFQGDSAKGAYIDLTAAASGVGTNLLTPSSSTDGWARNQANAAFLQANTPSATANSAASYANSAFLVANGAASVANTDYTTLSTTAGVYGNAAYHPVVTLTSNGRVSSITNTAIAISADAITSGTLSNTRGGTGTTSSTGTGSVVLGTAPTITLPTINNIRQGYSTTVTAAGTTILSVNSNRVQFFTGTTTQILSLPAPQTMTLGMEFLIVNNSTGNIEVRASNSATVAIVLPGTAVSCISIDLTAGNGAAGWNAEIVGFSTITGTGAVVLNTSPTLVNVSVSSVNVTNTTASTSKTTGALQVAGGVGVAGNVSTLGINVDNRIDWAGTGYAQPSFTTRSAGQKITLYPAISGSAVDYSIGIDGGVLWSTVPVSSNEYSFKWYGGQTQIASLSGVGTLDVISANITSSNTSTSNTTGALRVTGGVGVRGNVATDGVIFADGTRQTTAAVGGGASIGDVLALAIALG